MGKKLIAGFVILFLVLPIIFYAYWYYSDVSVKNILILDKTVLTKKGDEHRSFNWLLTHYKIYKQDSSAYKVESDYVGFFPLENHEYDIHDLDGYQKQELELIADSLDMLYYTDTYGIYHNEWYQVGRTTEHSPKIYGGLSLADYHLLRLMKEQRKPIVTEFNLIASPTAGYVRRKTEALFDIQWSGWTARYFDVLDTMLNDEIPHWVIKLQLEQYSEWPFMKSGIVFIHEDETILILEDEIHLEKDRPRIETSELYQDRYNLPSKIYYPFWIDIMYNKSDSNEIVSTYNLYTNGVGDSCLLANDIPKQFPAVIARTSPYVFYYFAGDFADNPVPSFASYFKGSEYFYRYLYMKRNVNDRQYFFWNYYLPLMKTILTEQKMMAAA